MKILFHVASVAALVFLGFAGGPAACSSNSSGNGAGGSGDGGGSDDGNCGYSCTSSGGSSSGLVLGPGGEGGANLMWDMNCSKGQSTSISGKVYDPAGKNPIYNVTVYVPGVPTPLPALPQGVTCNSCMDLYSVPKADAVTDPSGSFTIPNAPHGANIPLVVQVGKWRKVYTIANVTECQDNPQDKLLLPKNAQGGDSLPQIAVSTGAADSLECLLFRMGVDASEFTGGNGGTGHIHIFTSPGGATANGGSPDPSMNLWNNATDIDAFDVVLLSCEGAETMNMNQQVLYDYANKGGRVFASHFHYAWFDTGPFATMINPPLATWNTGVQDKGNISSNVVTTLPGGGAFPEGADLLKWLGNVGALGVGGAPSGELPIVYACNNANVTSSNTNSQAWVTADKSAPVPGAAEYFSFDLPAGSSAEGKCGRTVYSDMHVSGGPGMSRGSLAPDYASSLQIVPDQCATGDLSPQEKALEFMIFDLSSCLIPIGTMSKPPVPM